MSNKALQSIIDRQNQSAKFENKPLMDIETLTTEQANDLFNTIDAGMSPENLHCDGEITRAQARAKATVYRSAVNQLKNLGFAIPTDCYEIY